MRWDSQKTRYSARAKIRLSGGIFLLASQMITRFDISERWTQVTAVPSGLRRVKQAALVQATVPEAVYDLSRPDLEGGANCWRLQETGAGGVVAVCSARALPTYRLRRRLRRLQNIWRGGDSRIRYRREWYPDFCQKLISYAALMPLLQLRAWKVRCRQYSVDS